MVTVLVPMRNEEAFIGECLDSLIQQDYPADRMEVLVMDGRSEDASRAIVLEKSQEHTCIHLLDNPEQSTPAALNIGIRNASGDMIVRLDAHHRAAQDFVSQHVACLSKPDVDCAGGPIHTISRTYVGEAISLAMSCPFGVGDAYFRYAEKEQYVDTVANAGYSRDVFERIGLFDEALIGAEDDEFNYRLRAKGGRILLSPRIRSWYYCRESLGKLWRQYFRYGHMKVRVLQSHPRQMRWRQFVPPAFVSALLTTLALALLGIRWPLLLVAGSYTLANLAISVWVAVRSGMKYLPILPITFAVLHISYGLGFLSGLFRFAHRWRDRGTGEVLDTKQGVVQ
jgi:cellulose synthase/poly-beta-1,6-N-acetylglucosamine synthase-like glycosyltransferase